MIIGLTGVKGSGKSEVANFLMSCFGFQRVKFADPLKNMLRTMLRDVGHIESDIERYLEGDLKESVVDGIGVTARHLMVTLGTEWGRDQIAPDLWTRLWAAKAERFPFVLADDVRFPNEVDLIHSLGGVIWRIDRPGRSAGDHVSEQLPVGLNDYQIANVGTLADLHEKAHAAARVHGLTPCA